MKDIYSQIQYILNENSSSTIDTITWHVGNKLNIKFKSTPTKIYVYMNFLFEDLEKFINADSVGKYFCSNIKNKYAFEIIEIKQ